MTWPTRVPEPALFRAVLVTITAVVAWWLGREVSTEWVDTITTLYMIASGAIAGALIRPKVTSMARLRQLGIELPAAPAGKHARQDPAE